MKAYELMALAAKEPEMYEGKRYEVLTYAVDCFGNLVKEFVINVDGEFVHEGQCVYIKNDTLVEQVTEPVSFMEAVKVFEEGTTIRCEVEDINEKVVLEYVYLPDENCEWKWLNESQGGSVSAREILQGKWYIGNK